MVETAMEVVEVDIFGSWGGLRIDEGVSGGRKGENRL
jgi:hypothetical protein